MVVPIGLALGTTDLIGIAYVLTGLGLLALLRQPLTKLDKPGSTGFLLAVLAISLWPLSVGINTFIADLGLSKAIYTVRLLAAALVSIGWFLLAYEFTTQRMPSRPILGMLGGYVLIGQVLAWINPGGIVLAAGTTVQDGVLLTEPGPWFWLQAVINYGLIIGATGLLITEWVRTAGLRRRQSALLAFAVLPPIAANLLTILEIVNTAYDLTPFGLLGSGLILSWTLYRLELLNIVPVGRNVAIEEMEDAVVTVDETNRVIDCNAAALELFNVDENYYGDQLEEVFTNLPEELFDRISDSTTSSTNEPSDAQTEVSVEIDGNQRHFSLTRSVVSGTGATPLGQVLVFRDITQLKNREADLELLRQVLTRILRHNLRTNLNVIDGYVDLLQEEYQDQRLERIQTATGSLANISQKATHIETIIQADIRTETIDIMAALREAASELREEYPHVTVAVSGPQRCHLRLPPGLPVVIDILFENGIEHNESQSPRLDVTIDTAGDDVTLQIADNGPGIPSHELAVLRTRSETPLHHGSGIGLWIVRWWADRAEVSLAFDTDDDGTTVSLTFPESTVDTAD